MSSAAARAEREPERHTHTIRRLIGSEKRALSSSRNGTHLAPGACPASHSSALRTSSSTLCSRPASASVTSTSGIRCPCHMLIASRPEPPAATARAELFLVARDLVRRRGEDALHLGAGEEVDIDFGDAIVTELDVAACNPGIRLRVRAAAHLVHDDVGHGLCFALCEYACARDRRARDVADGPHVLELRCKPRITLDSDVWLGDPRFPVA